MRSSTVGKGTSIFDGGSDMFQNGLSGLAGLLALFVKFIGGGCDRKPDGGKDNHGYFTIRCYKLQ